MSGMFGALKEQLVDLSKREALKALYRLIIAIGASTFFSFEDLLAFEKSESKDIKPNIIWLHGSSCSGCSASLLNIENITVMDFLLKFTNLIFHPDISLATGDDVVKLLNKAAQKLKDDYMFVLEGSVPASMPHACMMGELSMLEWTKKMASNASLCISAGTCASFGGVSTMGGMVTGTIPLAEVMRINSINKEVINLPNCPMKPEHLLYVILYYTKFKKIPELDSQARPKIFFSKTVHQTCIHYSSFQEGDFAKKIGDGGCLKKLGCQGPITKNDCMIIGNNGNTNTCIKAGHPCIGCAGEHFPRQIMFHSYGDKREIVKFIQPYIVGK